VTATSDDRPRFRAAWLALGWALVAAVVVGSLLPSASVPALHLWDKLEHLAAYGVLAFVFAGALGRARWQPVLWGLLALGAGLEVAQGLAGAGRGADPWDMVANTLGVITGLGLAIRVPGGWCRRVEARFLAEGGAR